ncbi:MAG TPA: nucleoside 2-deoxyribosyltransferase [Candidatus Saccharimonadales bacterium]|nr:nucleoside 2-deoxyribosyltransferase [Candidatus Saccharimonadales bacterium]
MKTVYFACSIAGGRDYAFVYKDLVKTIKSCGVEVHGELFADPNLEAETGTNPEYTPEFVYKRDTRWLRESDAFIADASQPSLGVGYEIALAENLGKPVLVLFYKNSLNRFSPMIVGNPNIQIFEYTEHTKTQKAIKEFIKKLG